MLARFAAFEIKYQVLSPLFIAVGLIFFLLAFGSITVGQVYGAGEGVYKNSPYAVNAIVLTMSLFGLFIPTAFLASVVLRDRAYNTESLFFTRPVRKTDYLLGRFLGAYAVSLLVFMSVPLGVLLGSLMPWLDPAKVGPARPFDYAYAIGVFAAPNLLVVGAILFTVANLTRSNMATYTALVLLLMLYLTGANLANEPSQRALVATLDPFGFLAFREATRYWTPSELNTLLPPLEGVLLWNRLVWLGLALTLVIVNVLVFSFRARGVSLRRQRVATDPEAGSATVAALPTVAPNVGAGATARQFFSRVRYEIAGMLKSVPLWVLLALGLFYALSQLLRLDPLYGTSVYPLTRVIIENLQNSFNIVPYVILIYFASELVWRDRGYNAHEVIDATPTPSWAFVLSKLLAMWLMLVALACVEIAAGCGVQLARGFTDMDLWLYVHRLLFVDLYPLFLVATLSIFVQTVANNRYVGWLVMLAYVIGNLVLTSLGFENNLYHFAGAPAAPMSDMNGDGHFLEGVFWFDLYWSLFSGVLLFLMFALWNRGTLTPIWRRLALMPRRASPTVWAVFAVLVVAFAATGGYIFYNTNVLNEHLSQKAFENRAVDYEKKYRQYEELPQPQVIEVKLDVDIFPGERRYDVRGTYVLENRARAPIEQVHVNYRFQTDVRSQKLEGGVIEMADEPMRYFIWQLETPMQPGEERTLSFTVASENPGFRNSRNVSSVVSNGTFINNAEAMPWIGFNREQILQDRSARLRHHLEPVDRLPRLEDDAAASRNFRPDSDWVTFETTVSTSPDQIAVAPGHLEREWTQDGRRYFHYMMDVPIAHAFSFVSARYAVRQEDAGGAKLQVFHDPRHPYNVDRMLESMRDSLDYYGTAFGPYQFRELRIFEFPIFFGRDAQAFPNSIPYSEGLGFIADNRDPRKIDYVYYVTAHETAHQWWGNQVLPAKTQGAMMLTETFAQYSALMVMEHKYGSHQIRRFMKYELDMYLSGRGQEQAVELPLYRVENQNYVYYHKGALVMYALKDYLGEETVNRALARFLREYAYRSDPYPRSTDFLRILVDEAGPDRWRQELIADLFQKMVLFDLRTTDLQVTRRPDGKYDTKLTVEAKKLEAAGKGVQTEVSLDYRIDVGFFTRDPADVTRGSSHVLFFEKRPVHSGENVFEVILDEPPLFGGIDPYNKLVDRNPDDNLRQVDKGI